MFHPKIYEWWRNKYSIVSIRSEKREGHATYEDEVIYLATFIDRMHPQNKCIFEYVKIKWVYYILRKNRAIY